MKTKQLISLIAAVAAMLWIAFLSPEMEGLSPKGKAALGVGVFAIIVWVTQALDDAQSGFCIVAFLNTRMAREDKRIRLLLSYKYTGNRI